MLTHYALAQRLPDLPRWVEVRDLLLSDECEVFGLQETPELSFVLRDPHTASVFVVGVPSASAIQDAADPAARGANVVAPQEHAAWLEQLLPAWTRARIIVHTLPDDLSLPADLSAAVAFLDPRTLDNLALPAELLAELKSGAQYSPIAAAWVANRPVSFCYAGSLTETLWDVAIDTLPDHRRQGHAGLCAAHMICHMRTQGKQPVWQALEENPGSWRLAQKLGFIAVDELAFFEPGH